jgi:hypothetical protein
LHYECLICIYYIYEHEALYLRYKYTEKCLVYIVFMSQITNIPKLLMTDIFIKINVDM